MEKPGELVDNPGHDEARRDTHSGCRRMGELVVTGDNATHAERREERGHDARGKDTGAAVIAMAGDIMAACVVVSAEYLANEQHHQQEQESKGAEGRIDEHRFRTLS